MAAPMAAGLLLIYFLFAVYGLGILFWVQGVGLAVYPKP